jgi:hypothetical protein
MSDEEMNVIKSLWKWWLNEKWRLVSKMKDWTPKILRRMYILITETLISQPLAGSGSW